MKNPPVLDKLGFTKSDGFFHCDNIKNNKKAMNNYELLYLNEAEKLGADAVYFRRFYKNNTPTPDDSDSVAYSQPAVYIFDRKDGFFDSEEHKKLHAALWSAGQAEVYIILTKTRIDIINARQPAKRIETERGSDVTLDDKILKLNKYSSIIKEFNNQRFSAHLFGNGTFWEQSEFQENVNDQRNPSNLLLDYLKRVRSKIAESNLNLDASLIDRLLVVSILIKFLEEIKDGEEKYTVQNIYDKKNIKYFWQALDNNQAFDIIDDLANEFNGKIFDIFSEEEKKIINDADLSLISKFLRANIDIGNDQFFIWEQYDFKHLPAEVISTIYEYFIQVEALRKEGKTEKGVVYTPIHLVNLLIDEVMPLDKPELFENNTFKVLDPACGSGVFLVAAYKRMLQWWTINNFRKAQKNNEKQETKEIKIEYPKIKVAQQILEENIFGVDTAPTAVLVSVFGLTIALLDKLTPKEIWDDLKLKNLKEDNIRENNFFKWANKEENKERKFDLVIGNPPFNEPDDVDIKDIIFEKGEKEEKEKDLALFGVKLNQIPRKSFALMFLEGALHFGKKVCMIIPSKVILYDKSKLSQRYRNRIFINSTVEKIFDFTHLRRVLFHKTADISVAALSIDNQPSNQQTIQHIIVKREYFSEKRIRFEINYYDHHKVPWRWAVDEDKQFIWKTNLLGGGQLFHLIYRFSLLRTLGVFIKEKVKQAGWKKIRGFERGDGKIRLENQDVITGIDENNELLIDKNIEIKTNNLKDEFMYEPPFLILRQILGVPQETLSAYFVAHKNQFTNKPKLYYDRNFLGISAPKEEEQNLAEIFASMLFINGKLNYQLYSSATSSTCIVSHDTAIREEDILSLPFPTDKKYLKLSKTEKIIQDDVLQYYIHLGKAIGEKDDGYPLHQPTTRPQLKAFGKTYCDSLNEIYAEDNNSWQIGEVIHTDTFIYYQFGFGENGGLKYEYDDEDKVLNFKSLLENEESNKGAIYKRIIRYYDHVNDYDCVYLIKPNSLRYWLKSIALQDAGDTFMDLKNAGY